MVLARLLGRDIQSVTGKNLCLVQELTQLNPWTAKSAQLKATIVENEMVDVPPQDLWRLPYLCSLLTQRGTAFFLANEEEQDRLTDLIHSLVTN